VARRRCLPTISRGVIRTIVPCLFLIWIASIIW
jgi:hypothetical protein